MGGSSDPFCFFCRSNSLVHFLSAYRAELLLLLLQGERAGGAQSHLPKPKVATRGRKKESQRWEFHLGPAELHSIAAAPRPS